ncbi:hypothetical protein EKG83_10940 [Saccharothrix syringae]|uniref:Fibronectin type-III domain-containing protein n=1 Tax=Saccharothrix syringae TaxID=103733 RepID=A0A5Q0HCX7_SACSY|nr:hypothetical protein EKG83_10940 [Saccharothrix syringae]
MVAGLVVGAGTAAAAQGDLTQNYTCPFPLIGDQNVTVNIKTTQPATITTGTFTPKIDITAVSNAGATATQGLRLVGAETIQGSARATSTVTAPGDQGRLTVHVVSDVPNQPIPAVGNDLVVNATGAAPGLRFDEPGTATVEVTDLVLTMTPLRADGTPTDLGTFVADCTPAAGQGTVLQTYQVTGPEVAPETPSGVGQTPPLRQTYTCPLPLIGNQNVVVDIDTDDLPDEVAVGEFTPPIRIAAVSNAGPTSTQGLRLVGAETIQGKAVATSLVSAPQGHQAVAVENTVPNQPIPPVGNDLVINASGTAPALRFDQPGTATLSVHDLVLTMTPLRADGTPTGLGTFVADCTPTAGQRTVLHTFTVVAARDTEAPTAPAGLTAGEPTQGSVPLSWTAATDNVGVTGYDVYNGATLIKSVEGTSTTVDGLAADTEYTFTVRAKDAAGNTSQASNAVTARTKAAPDTSAPTAPGDLAATGATPTSVSLAWAAASDNVGVTGYEVLNGTTAVATATGTTATVDNLTPDTEYTFTVRAKDAAGNTSEASNAVTVRTPATPDTEGPSAPTDLTATGVTQSSVTLSWTASTDNVGVVGYDVYNGATVAKTVQGAEATVDGLTPDTEYTFTVRAKDAAGNTSQSSNTVIARTRQAPDTSAPSAPDNLRSPAQTKDSVELAWDAATDNVGVVGYEVLNGTTPVATATGTTATVNGLTADTEYTFTVRAKDAAGNVSGASAALKVRTKAEQNPPTVDYGYKLDGSTGIKAANGTVALKGGIDAKLDLTSGAFQADLVLDPTSGRFKAFGFVPVRANIEFVQAGKTTGTLANGALKATANVTVKLPRVTVLGIPVSTSPNCRTKTPAQIPLDSRPGFDPLAGGTLTGTYTLPALTGCGPLNGLISGLTAGPGNTIEVKLAPRTRAVKAPHPGHRGR